VVEVDFTAPGAARDIIDQLIDEAGSLQAINVELDATFASLSILTGQTAVTYAYRNGVIGEIDSDIEYVGQTIFDPRDFAIDNVGELFAQAANVCGSDTAQHLQIVEYADNDVYMTVTTNPETMPVFFRENGSIVHQLDFSTVEGVNEGLSDVTKTRPILRFGITGAANVLYADRETTPGTVIRTQRMTTLPARDTDQPDNDPPLAFDPALIDPRIIISVVNQLPELTGSTPGETYDLQIDRRAGGTQPFMYFTAEGQTIRTNLHGVVLPED
jgi:hypothetical protein